LQAFLSKIFYDRQIYQAKLFVSDVVTEKDVFLFFNVKVKVKQSHYRLGQRRRMVVGCQPYAPAAFTLRKYSWYSFLLEA